MIYSDKYGYKDTEDNPTCRGNEYCLNCHKLWIDHYGWNCDQSALDFDFQSTPVRSRYLTQSMKDSLDQEDRLEEEVFTSTNATTTANTAMKTDISDWRSWKHNLPGDCPCGINKNDCIYHR